MSTFDKRGPSVHDTGAMRSHEVVFNAEQTYQGLGKGQRALPEKGQLITDTGDFRGLEVPEGIEKLTPDQMDSLYRQTIRAGVIDHHFIDSATRGRVPDGYANKCATKMVADFPGVVLEVIGNKREEGEDIRSTNTHFDSDLDAVSSSYLTQSLIQHGQAPAISEKLGNFVNKVDYGNHRESDPEKFLTSLAGLFSATKFALGEARGRALGAEVFGNPAMKDSATGRLNTDGVKKMGEIQSKFEQLLGKYSFELINASNQAVIANPEFDLESGFAELEAKFSPGLRSILDGSAGIKGGKDVVRETFKDFNEDFEKVEHTSLLVKNLLTGENMTVPVIVALEPKSGPLVFTNLAYQRTSWDTIVAVYGGPNRKQGSGDMYDIGIMPDSAKLIDLAELCVALNRAEKAKRDTIFAKVETERLNDEQALATKWASLPDRLGMSGPEQIITKDPTVLVAGGSLIAASNTSLLNRGDFKAAILQSK